MKVSVVSKRRSACAEGPHWDEKTKKLWHVDVHGKEICRLDPVSQETEHVPLDGYATLLIPYESNPERLLVSEDLKLVSFDWNSPEDRKVVAQVNASDLRLNDGKCDALGRLWFGSMGIENSPSYLSLDAGSVYSLEEDNESVKTHLNGVGISNGLAWTKDNSTMFYIDSLAKNVVAYDFDLALGQISNRRVVHQFEEGEGFPDGMCTDAEDKIWVACFDGSKVIRIDPEIGVRMETISFPAAKITSCCFGGTNYETLFVTSAHVGEESPSETSGAVFQVTGLGIKGLPPNTFGKSGSA